MPNYAIQEQNQDMVSLLSAYFRLLYNPTHSLADALPMLQTFPAIRGLWGGSAVGGSGEARDEINGLHLTNNSNANFGYRASRQIPRIGYSGSNYHSRASEASFNITGTEAYVQAGEKGLAMGAWVQFSNAASATEMIMSKRLTPNDISYSIHRDSTGHLVFIISVDGATQTSVTTTDTMSAGVNYFVFARFIPSTSIEARINNTTVINTTSIPASIFSGAASFLLAGNGVGSNLMTGSITFAFLCASAVPDQFIDAYYQMTAPLFGISV